MTTVKIRIPEALKACIAASAERAGTTAHSFILEVVAEKVEQEERRADFLAVADQRYANLVAAGKSIPWEKMRSTLANRIAGKSGTRPVAKKRAS